MSVLTKERVREIFMAHGFMIKEGQTDLKAYVYAAADALVDAALAADRAARAEPVAWQFREIGEGGWTECDKQWFDYCNSSPLHDARALYTAPPAAPVPEDMVLVPVEPSQQMLREALRVLLGHGEDGNIKAALGEMYVAMLAAAPAPSQGNGGAA